MSTRDAQSSQATLRADMARVMALHARGRQEEAAALCESLLGRLPREPVLLVLKARLCRERGRYDEAEACLDKAAALAPSSAALLSESARLAVDTGAPAKAVAAFESLVDLRPEDAESWFNLAHARELAHGYDAALAAYEQALTLGLSAPEDARVRMAGLLTILGREEQALEVFRQVLRREPGNAGARYGTGMIRQAMGDFDTAEKEFLRALDSDPGFVEVYQQIAENRRFEDPEDPLRLRLQALLGGDISDLAREKLNFALGKIANDCGEYARAFSHFENANQLKKARQPAFDREAFRRLSETVIRFFDHDPAETSPVGDRRAPVAPVFIVGMPRSGTSLIEQIAASHPQVAGAGELAFMESLSRTRVPDYPGGLAGLDAGAIAAMREGYLSEISRHVAGHEVVTDKYPGNFLHLGLISLLFPEARFVWCRRDPMDNCMSIYFQDFGTGNYYASDLEDIAFYFRRHLALMTHWQAVMPERILEVSYEKVVADQAEQTRRLLEFLGLPWHDACLAFEKTPRKVSTLSRWQVRQPIYRTSAGRWKHYKRFLQPLRTALESAD